MEQSIHDVNRFRSECGPEWRPCGGCRGPSAVVNRTPRFSRRNFPIDPRVRTKPINRWHSAIIVGVNSDQVPSGGLSDKWL